MSYKAAAALKQKIELDFIKSKTPEELNEIFNTLHGRIKELENPWIDVKERIPEVEGNYICGFSDGAVETFPFEEGDEDLWGLDKDDFVEYWMEFPPTPIKKNG